jgi:hypothetical protein
MVYVLENNEYVKKRSVIKKQNLQALKNKITAEITALDSVKLSVQDLLSNERTAQGTFLTSPSEVNLQIVTLYERILDIETAIKLSGDIQIIENFTKTTKPDGPLLRPYLIRSIIIGCVLSALFIVVKLINKKLKDFSTSKTYSV